jgi:dolichol-phosphate mannosyltransferase
MVIFLISAYNEENNIVQTLEKIKFKMLNFSIDYKLIVVEDGSRDGTLDKLRTIEKEIPIKIVRHYSNMGVAAAFKRGLAETSSIPLNDNDIIIVWEGDNTNNPELINNMIAKLRQSYDVVCASRYTFGGRSFRVFSFRFLLSRCANGLLKLLFPIKGITDYTHFPRAYRFGILKEGFFHYGDKFIESSDFAYSAEVLLKLKRINAKITQMPHLYRYDLRKGNSKLRILRSTIDHIRLIVRML